MTPDSCHPPNLPPSPADAPLIVEVEPESAAHRAGVRPGDRLLKINDEPVEDLIDVRFHGVDEHLVLETRHDDHPRRIRIKKDFGAPLGIEIEPFKTRVCRNNCLFCFVRQQPTGLRPELRVRDDDYRMSFLHGNYITGTNMTSHDLERIARLRLSPLYFSVHTTDPDLRGKMLGRPHAEPIEPILRRLTDEGLFFHTQIVVCPGLNDGAMLTATLNDLADYHPACQSIAIVPAGLTAHRDGLPQLRPTTPAMARRLIDETTAQRRRLARRLGEDIVFLADEIWLLARRKAPRYAQRAYYEQVENGVGMVHEFYHGFQPSRLIRRIPTKRHIGLLTSPLGHLALTPFIDAMNRHDGVEVTPLIVPNQLYGHSVTVTGLLGGRDIIDSACPRVAEFDRLYLPPNALRDDAVFLDDVSLEDARGAIPLPLAVGPDSAMELARDILSDPIRESL